MINLWPLLLPAAAFSGWWIARRNDASKHHQPNRPLSHEYVVGLNYLLNEQPDKAVDVFIKLLEVSNLNQLHIVTGKQIGRAHV